MSSNLKRKRCEKESYLANKSIKSYFFSRPVNVEITRDLIDDVPSSQLSTFPSFSVNLQESFSVETTHKASWNESDRRAENNSFQFTFSQSDQISPTTTKIDSTSTCNCIPGDISQSFYDQPKQPSYSFPLIRKYRMNSVHYKKHAWIEYSIKTNKIFCYTCRHHGDNSLKDYPIKFIVQGFDDYHNSHDRFARHSSNEFHRKALARKRVQCDAAKR
jgi:hypothetical protein